jgi:hypothetical protein
MIGRPTERLTSFLREASSRQFCYGSFDCFLFVADWCAEARGVDPGRTIRGRYGDLTEGLTLVGVSSLPMAFHRLLVAAGLRQTRSPKCGDIALIALGDGMVRGAIVTSLGYVVLAEKGLSRVSFAARRIAAWTV